MKRNYIIYILLALILGEMGFIYYLHRINHSMYTENEKYGDYLQYQLIQKGLLENHIIIQNRIVGNLLENTTVSNRNGETYELKQLLKDQSYIFYIPVSSCSSCNANIFEFLPSLIETLNSKINIICPSEDLNSITALIKQSLNNKIIYVNNSSLFSIKEFMEYIEPVFLKVDKEGRILSAFFINNQNFDFFKYYLDYCK